MLKIEVRHEYNGENPFILEITCDSRAPDDRLVEVCLSGSEVNDLFRKLGHAIGAERKCLSCNGRGWWETEECRYCKGEGQRPM